MKNVAERRCIRLENKVSELNGRITEMEHVLQNHYEALKKAEQWAGLVDEHIGELSEVTEGILSLTRKTDYHTQWIDRSDGRM
mgnify:FL=1|tara:strand:+ start:1377 stop:1625 length:249 start_codon:yes stop_codon:yes gene_type:complete